LQQQEAREDVSGQSTKESGESTTDDSEKGAMELIMMISVVDLSLVDWAEKKCVNFPNSEDSPFFVCLPQQIYQALLCFQPGVSTATSNSSNVPDVTTIVKTRASQLSLCQYSPLTIDSDETVVFEKREPGSQVPVRNFQPISSALSRELGSLV
jgi:hypothetical protein